MPSTPVLGPFVFNQFEVPEAIRVGGRQRLAIHELPGGGRVVDAMGPEEGPIRWSGVFSGQDAAARIRVLERLRRRGDVLPLSWDAWRFSVIVQEFSAEVKNPWWIPYQIELCVVIDQETSATADWIDIAAESVGAVVMQTDVERQLAEASATLSSGGLADVVLAARQLAELSASHAMASTEL